VRYLPIIILLSACGSQFDACVDQQREAYRAKHPDAKHSELTAQYLRFQQSCSEFKGK